mmetsp:Transcript_47278/g.145612  ORF Transcript_47278/g.145612 Transcript_47278/m.145612 type:complete len:222 (-) Transcript_47278:247-912(-)
MVCTGAAMGATVVVIICMGATACWFTGSEGATCMSGADSEGASMRSSVAAAGSSPLGRSALAERFVFFFFFLDAFSPPIAQATQRRTRPTRTATHAPAKIIVDVGIPLPEVAPATGPVTFVPLVRLPMAFCVSFKTMSVVDTDASVGGTAMGAKVNVPGSAVPGAVMLALGDCVGHCLGPETTRPAVSKTLTSLSSGLPDSAQQPLLRMPFSGLPTALNVH